MNAEVDALPDMLARLKLTAMRDRLDGLLDEAARGDLWLRETLALLCRAEMSHREERRIRMGTEIAKLPHQRTLESFDFAANPRLMPSRCATWPPAAGWPTALEAIQTSIGPTGVQYYPALIARRSVCHYRRDGGTSHRSGTASSRITTCCGRTRQFRSRPV